MALPLRPRAIPQCSACLRSDAWASFADSLAPQQNALRQQVRGKKKAAKASTTVPARLLKDLPGFGKRGSIVPITRGELRSYYFPRGIAKYVTLTEQRELKRDDIPIERDYNFGQKAAPAPAAAAIPSPTLPIPLYEQKAPEVEKLTAERSMELLEIFVSHRLDFYREPIMEERPEKPAEAEEEKEDMRRRTASSAAADLLAARSSEKAKPKMTGAIYGSVSTRDILVAVRAAIATNDEAARVLISERDIHFLDEQHQSENKIKAIGDFTIRIQVEGADEGIKRTVRVIPQEHNNS